MKPTAEILTGDESCHRRGFWSLQWEPGKLKDTEFLQHAIRVGLTSPRKDFSEAAREAVIEMIRDRELETSGASQYDSGIHISFLASLITEALRPPGSPPWRVPAPVAIGRHTWRSSAFLDPQGLVLRKVVLASNWSDDRHYSECRAWGSLGEICAYGAPMQLAVCVLGQNRNGKRHSWWTHGLRHPFSKQLRFRRRNQIGEGFKDSWKEVWREDDDTVPASEWLDSMAQDGVLKDVFFRVDIEVPPEDVRKRFIRLAEQKLDRLYSTKSTPEPNLSTCSWPSPCVYRRNCHKEEEPSGRYGFLRVEELAAAGQPK